MEHKTEANKPLNGVLHGPYKPDDVPTAIGQIVGLKEILAYDQLEAHKNAVIGAERDGFIDQGESILRQAEIDTEQHRVLYNPYYPDYVRAVLDSAPEHGGDTLGLEFYANQAEMEQKKRLRIPTNLTFDLLKYDSLESAEELTDGEKLAKNFVDWFEQQYKRAGVIQEDDSLKNPDFLDDDGNETLTPRKVEFINSSHTPEDFSLFQPSRINFEYGIDDPDCTTNREMVYIVDIHNAISSLQVELIIRFDKLPTVAGEEKGFIGSYRIYAGDAENVQSGYSIDSRRPNRYEQTYAKIIANTLNDIKLQLDSGDFVFNPPDSGI